METDASSAQETQAHSVYPPFVPADQLDSAVLPPDVPLIVGIIDQGSKLAIGGGSKSYKTWVMLDLALAVSVPTGSQWLTFETRAGPVVYVNYEMPPGHLRKRLRELCAFRQIAMPSNLLIWNLRGMGSDAKMIQGELLRRIGIYKPALVVVDPLYKYGGGIDENSTADMIGLFSQLDKLIGVGPSVAYAGHFSKGNQAAKNAIDRVSGSGVHGREPDAIINFTAHQVSDAYTVDIILRYYPAQPSFVVRWSHPAFKVDVDLDPKKLLRSGGGGRPPAIKLEQLFQLLKLQRVIADDAAFFNLASLLLEAKKSTFYNLLKSLPSVPGVARKSSGEWVYNGEPVN